MSFFASSQAFSFGLDKLPELSVTDQEIGKPSNLTGKFLKSTEHKGSILIGNLRIFSDDFRTFPAGKNGKLAGSHRKNPQTFQSEYCSHVPLISGVFLQDPARIS